jgi:SAM-dependent methyltransferase
MVDNSGMSDMAGEEGLASGEAENLRSLLHENTLLIELLDPKAAWAGLDGDTVVLPAVPTSRAPGNIPITVRGLERAWDAIVETVADVIEGRPGLRVLELGAGMRTLFHLPPDAHVVGVGRDGDALERNRRLNEKVVAHVEDYRPRGGGFDLVVGWYVLDYLASPAVVLDRVARWTVPGGLVVLAVANPRSPQGLASRLRGEARLKRAAWPDALRHRLAHRGFTPLLQAYFADGDDRPRRRLLTRVASLGALDPARTDFVSVFRRDPT